jgi:diguanylate cyclase (GGDEF)-like protein
MCHRSMQIDDIACQQAVRISPMDPHPIHSIKITLMKVIMLTCGVALVVAGSGLVISDLIITKRAIINQLMAQANILGDNGKTALLTADRKSAEQTLWGLSTDSSIVAAAIYSRNDSLFAAYLRKNAQNIIIPPHSRSYGYHIENGHLHFFSPVVVDGERIGTVYLRDNLQDLYSRLRLQGVMFLSVLLLSYLLAWLVSSRLQRRVSGPILNLARAARSISKNKDYGLRVKSESDDELGILVSAFNHMLAQIQHRDEKLERHRAHLEELIKQRTAELRTANHRLRHQAQRLEELVTIRTAELHRLNEQLSHQVSHDSLTRLPNRTLFNDRLTQDLLNAQRRGQPLALLFLDLDRFKVINDTLGHATGDRLLCLAAERLRKVVRKGDTVARLGGDEFTVLLSTLDLSTDAEKVAQKIIQLLEKPFYCDGNELHVTTSVGIAIYPKDGADSETLMRNADTAMYMAKQHGKNGYRFYDHSMNAASLERLEMESRLRSALEEEEFVVHYQPQWSIRSGQIAGVEALVRWCQPEKGLIAPSAFVPMLEDTGLIVPLGAWVLRNACRQARAWRNAGVGAITVAVNCSSRQFADQRLVRDVQDVLQETGLEPNRLTLEITENAFMENHEELLGAVRSIRGLGIHLAIDHFGAGYSSLAYLKRFPVDTVKIDKSFTQDIPADPDGAAIVKAIIAMAHNLNIQVVAEGVETDNPLAFLKTHGCDYVQGYLLGAPLPGDEMGRMLS